MLASVRAPKQAPRVRPKDLKASTRCPACGSQGLVAAQSRAQRVRDRVLAAAATGIPVVWGPKGRRCIDCGWQVA